MIGCLCTKSIEESENLRRGPSAAAGRRHAALVEGRRDLPGRGSAAGLDLGDDRREVGGPAPRLLLPGDEACRPALGVLDPEVAAVAAELRAARLRSREGLAGALLDHAGFKLGDTEHLPEHELADRPFRAREIAEA